MSRINLYAQNRHTLIIDGVQVSGFADGDWLQVKKDGNAAARTHGGDGPGMSISTDQGGQININLMPTSPALGYMYQLRGEQQASPRMFSVVLQTGVEETIVASGCAFGDLPQMQSGGPVMQGRQFLLECLSITMDTSEVEGVAGGSLLNLIPTLF